MPDYKAMYFALAARVADAVDLLVRAQRAGEDSAIRDDPPALRVAPQPDDEET